MNDDTVFEALRRHPDVEAPGLEALDAADRLILAEARESGALDGEAAGTVVVLGDSYGAITLALATAGVTGIRVFQDSITGERALAENAGRLGLEQAYTSLPLSEDLLRGARVVLARLPRDLASLRALSSAVAAFAVPEVVVFFGGRIKHMTRTMNDVISQAFARLDVSLARQKSRVLRASEPRPGIRPAVADVRHEPRTGFEVHAEPGTFAGAGLDLGTGFLLDEVDFATVDATRILDLGCGTGILAVAAARQYPDASVVATDRSSAAVASARATADANGVGERVTVVRDDNGSSLDPESFDLILCNPPFHSDSAVTDEVAKRMLVAAGGLLAPGGRLITVFNSHLSHPATLRVAVGPTKVLARGAKFTVTRSTRILSEE